jgi:hypothetical protein
LCQKKVFVAIYHQVSVISSTGTGSYPPFDAIAGCFCWASTEIKDDLRQKVVTLSFGVGRSLSALDKTFCVHFSQSWAPSCVFELLEIYESILCCLV